MKLYIRRLSIRQPPYFYLLWWDFILPRVRDGYDGDNKTIHELNKSACFTEHTLIYTKDGYKEIKDIEVGDEVYSENPDTREQGLKRVLNVFVNTTKELIHLKVGEQEIKTTANHPFWVEGIGWVDAGDLKPSDRLVMYSGDILEVKEAFVEYLDNPIKVYNFEVEDWHTYFVTGYNVFVHNAGCGGSEVGGIPNIKKANNSNLPHAIERAVERNVFDNAKHASDALKGLSKNISKDGFPSNAILDTAHPDRVLVPAGNNGMVVYQVAKNGTAKLKTVLIAK